MPKVKIEPPPGKGKVAQNLLFDLQQMAYALVEGKNADTLSTLRKPASMEEGVRVKGGASENYKRMGRFGSMVYYWLAEDKPNYQKFRKQTLNFIQDERIRGHMGGEQGCSQPHDGMHLAATLLAHLLAIKTNDHELMIETDWWIGSYLAICQACYYPGYNRVFIPGFRVKDDPISENRDIIFQYIVLNRPLEEIRTESNGWRDKFKWQRFYLPVYLVVKIVEIEKISRARDSVYHYLSTAIVLPRFYAPMFTKRTNQSLYISIKIPGGTSGKSETVEWIDITDENVQYSRADGTIENVKNIEKSTENTDGKEKKVITASTKIPQSIDELNTVSMLPFHVANGLISQADKNLVKTWGESLYPNFGHGYLHSSDHYAALVLILDREPSFREVYDSYHGGSKNIDLARNKISGGNRPSGWDNWTNEQKTLAVLTHLYGARNGSRIFDGKMKDPDPLKTQSLMKLWGLDVETEPEEPKPEPEKPKPEPEVPKEPTLDIIVETHITVGGKKRIFRGVEVVGSNGKI